MNDRCREDLVHVVERKEVLKEGSSVSLGQHRGWRHGSQFEIASAMRMRAPGRE